MRLLFVRHGEMRVRPSEARDLATIQRLVNQELEDGLSDRGREQAAMVALTLRAHPVAAIYSSTMLRARETAAVSAAALRLEVTHLDELRELRPGRLPDGSPSARFARRVLAAPLPLALQRFLVGPTLIRAYYRSWRRGETIGGETPAELRMRTESAIGRIRAEQPDAGRVAVFAHGFLIRTLVRDLASGWEARAALARRVRLPNGSITELDVYPEGLRLIRFADARHLRGR